MIILLALSPIIVTGVLGGILDVKFKIQVPTLYWFLGVIGGITAIVIATT